jgi:hypothetical protein
MIGGRWTMTVAMAMAMAGPAIAQAPGYSGPRTSFGQPDLQGVWTNVSLTNLERPAQFKSLVIPPEEAARIEAARARARAAQDLPTNPDEGAPRAGQDVGGYNAFWADAGTHFGVVKGEVRSSWIVDPPDGRIPYSREGRKIFEDTLAFRRNTFDGPEPRPLAERCLVGFGSTAGPPMINVMYNNTYQFVQTPDHVMILVEMNHDARIIPLNSDTGRDSTFRWMGNSSGKWEGDTLVVTTTNFHPDEALRTFFASTFYVSPQATVTERFTRWTDDEILYEFSVDDPAILERPWRAEKVFRKASGPVYEYACHEGNYALPGILAGARKDDELGRKTEADIGE